MAHYLTKVRTAWSPEKAFTYMADLRNFANWDPGVRKVVQREGKRQRSDRDVRCDGAEQAEGPVAHVPHRRLPAP